MTLLMQHASHHLCFLIRPLWKEEVCFASRLLNIAACSRDFQRSLLLLGGCCTFDSGHFEALRGWLSTNISWALGSALVGDWSWKTQEKRLRNECWEIRKINWWSSCAVAMESSRRHVRCQEASPDQSTRHLLSNTVFFLALVLFLYISAFHPVGCGTVCCSEKE